MNNKGSESLFQASATCKLRLVRMLVEGGTSVNVRNERLETPLMLCCQSKTDPDEKRRVVTYLLGKKAKVNLQDIDGRTALIHASLSNSGKEIIQALLDAKSNPWLPDVSKNTVFDYVINAEDLETTRLLINACRESMLVDERVNGQMEHLEECLANIQDLRKFSWPLMGPRIRKNHMLVYAAENEEPSIPCNNLLGSDLGSTDQSKSPQPERRRKRSVCHFDPLDIQEILNCNEETESDMDNKENKDESKCESRKTSVRSLSEEERFSFQISDGEHTPRDPSSGLEKLLKLQDSFCSSLDSNEFPCTADDTTKSSAVDQHISEETNFIQDNKGVEKFDEVENKTSQGEAASSDLSDERQEVLNLTTKTKETTKECGRLFIHRTPAVLLSKEERFKSDSERQVMISSPTDTGKTGLENLENSSNPYTSLVTSHQSSPLVSPLSSPQVFRRQTLMSVTLKQSTSPRVSPVTVSPEQNRRELSIVRRNTMSAMDMGKLRGTGVAKTLLAPPVQSTLVETGKRRGSAVFESKPTARGDSEGNSTPPGLRKSKSDMTDWKSMSRNLQEKEFSEFSPKQATGMQGTQPSSDNSKLEGSDISQFQLPNILSAKKGRRSPKEFIYPVTPAAENKQPNEEPKVELALLHLRNNAEKQRLSSQSGQECSFDEQKCLPSPSLTTLPSSSKKHVITSPSNSFDKSDIVAVATFTELSLSGLDRSPGDVLPDLLLNCPHHDGDYLKQGGVISQNYNSRTFKDTTTANSNAPDERDVVGSSHGQQRTSPRLRPGTLLPPLLITNRRSPSHEMEDGYFSCSPSPADVESPRRKVSNEQLRYSFKPISPRSPVASSKAFALQSGKQPASR